MADKPKYQLELAERLSGIAKTMSQEFPEEGDEELPFPPSLLYICAFWETICREWTALDRLRLNKFYTLMQQFMKVGFEILSRGEFESEITSAYLHILREFPLKYELLLCPVTYL
jgi:ribosomal RNA-processing protein 1